MPPFELTTTAYYLRPLVDAIAGDTYHAPCPARYTARSKAADSAEAHSIPTVALSSRTSFRKVDPSRPVLGLDKYVGLAKTKTDDSVVETDSI